ncbi:MAG TPA: hypothetical protein DCP53_00595 [Elusimicrobia bacterium]|nr:MAG: hypothetical protein A2551_01915 [Elusimicrobia bacterium RIFOXYD2_FULL_34_30]HAM37890.1 hypothetical protein [Elusimicrobiota bacterium]
MNYLNKKIIKYMFYFIIFLNLEFVICNCLYAKGAGATAGIIMLNTPGVRQVSLGGSGVALGGDIYSIYQNPAGISDIAGKQISSVLENGLSNDYKASFVYGQGVYPLQRYGISIAVTYLNGGPMEINYIDGTSKNIISESDFLAILGWSMNTASNLSLGYNFKYLNSQLAEDYNSSAVAFDAGIIAKSITDEKIKLGLAAQNFGTSLKYRSKKEVLPTLIRGGLSYDIPFSNKSTLITIIDGFYLMDEGNFYSSLGIEYTFSEKYSFRTGYKISPDRGNATLGFGLKLYEKYFLDVAAEPNTINNLYKVSFTMKFDTGEYDKNNKTESIQELQYPEKTNMLEQKTEEFKKVMSSFAVTDFEAKNISQIEASEISDLIRSELINIGTFNVVEKNDMQNILTGLAFQQTSCATVECAILIGRILNVEKMVVGSVSKLIDTYYITVNLVEVATGEILKSQNEKTYSKDELSSLCRNIAQRISE